VIAGHRLPAVLAAACVAALGACSDDEPRPGTDDEPRSRTATREPADAPQTPAPPPDAGTATGHGADPARVAVPRRDQSPPAAEISLARPGGETLARVSIPGGSHPARVPLESPRLIGTTVGRDRNGGVARVRVSIKERITCSGAGGREAERLRTRYFPPPQVERIRSTPGAQLPTERRRSLELSLVGERCGPGGRAGTVVGELWGEAINGSGLEAVTPHIRFVYRRTGKISAEE
jgi:hypothetical protein